MKDKRYFWNGGVFVFPAAIMLQEIRRYSPRVFTLAKRINDTHAVSRFWGDMPSISVDYAIMEHTKKAALVRADYGWIDLGSWQAVIEVMKKDSDGNIFVGSCVDAGSRGILSWSGGRTVATIGLRDVIVVETPDAVLVCAKDKTQDVKKIVERLKRHRSRVRGLAGLTRKPANTLTR
jgi:mannose-1-phosphate guanylyltransferase